MDAAALDCGLAVFDGATLLPLLWLHPVDDFRLLAGLLLVHALSAATQDVSIDALCISVMDVAERGQYNGWMQAGMLLGRAMMGGGVLVLSRCIGPTAVVALLIAITMSSMLLVIGSRVEFKSTAGPRTGAVFRSAGAAIRQRATWFGLAFALVGGAAFKSLEVVYGPFLIDRGYEKAEIGWFSAGPMIGSMIAGSILGGWLADRCGRRRFVAVASVWIVTSILGLAFSDVNYDGGRGHHLLGLLACTAFGIGLFTAASYAMFMDITQPAVAATQFSAFMGATNGCESWSSFAVGRIIAGQGYPIGMIVMCLVSLAALPLLFGLPSVALVLVLVLNEMYSYSIGPRFRVRVRVQYEHENCRTWPVELTGSPTVTSHHTTQDHQCRLRWTCPE